MFEGDFVKVIDLIKGEKPSLSFEVFPPKTTDKYESVMQAATEIAKLKPSFMSVTYGAGGGTSEYTADIAEAISNLDVTPIAHLSCISSTKEQIKALLSALKEKKIENILALRGDMPKDPIIAAMEYHYASELAEEIRSFGGFCIGGACYPESHPESENSIQDIENLKKKVDAGCEFLTTQMFFDNSILYNFMYRRLHKGR